MTFPVHHNVHKRLPLVPTFSQMSPVHTLQTYLRCTLILPSYLCLILPSSLLPTRILDIYLFIFTVIVAVIIIIIIIIVIIIIMLIIIIIIIMVSTNIFIFIFLIFHICVTWYKWHSWIIFYTHKVLSVELFQFLFCQHLTLSLSQQPTLLTLVYLHIRV